VYKTLRPSGAIGILHPERSRGVGLETKSPLLSQGKQRTCIM
jgi:hypothetical protein